MSIEAPTLLSTSGVRTATPKFGGIWNFLQSWPAAPAAQEVQEERALWCWGKIAFNIPILQPLPCVRRRAVC
jgi:hypothetical protein